MSSPSPIPKPPPPPSQYTPPTDRNDPYLLSKQRAVLKRLKAWHRWEQDRQRSLVDYLLRTSPAIVPRPAIPSDEELLGLAEYYFPLREELVVTVCDYLAAGGADVRVVTVGGLDQCMYAFSILLLGRREILGQRGAVMSQWCAASTEVCHEPDIPAIR